MLISGVFAEAAWHDGLGMMLEVHVVPLDGQGPLQVANENVMDHVVPADLWKTNKWPKSGCS